MEFDYLVATLNILDAMKHPFKDCFVFGAKTLDDIVDGNVFESQNLHSMKYPLLFELSEFVCIDIDDDF